MYIDQIKTTNSQSCRQLFVQDVKNFSLNSYLLIKQNPSYFYSEEVGCQILDHCTEFSSVNSAESDTRIYFVTNVLN